MSKRKPTAKNIRQGQTVYLVGLDLQRGFKEYEVGCYFLYSHNEPLPPKHCLIDRMPVSHMRKWLDRVGNQNVYFSRRKAFNRCKVLNQCASE